MGELLAFCTALTFALSGLLVRVGQRQRPNDNGLFMTTVVNLLLYIVLCLGALLLGALPPLTWAGLLLFVLAGVTNTMVGRWSWFQSMRTLGPSRSTSLKVTNPAFAAVLAFAFLQQALGVGTILGIVFVVGGVALLNQEIARRVYGSDEEPHSPRETAQGIGLGLFSALSYGTGSVLRAAGLSSVPSPFLGALVGAVVASGGVLASDVLRRNLRRRWEENVRNVPIAYVLAGLLAGAGQITQFAALQHTTVARATVIASVEPALTVLLSIIWFRRLDTITPRSVLAVAGILVGVATVVGLG